MKVVTLYKSNKGKGRGPNTEQGTRFHADDLKHKKRFMPYGVDEEGKSKQVGRWKNGLRGGRE